MRRHSVDLTVLQPFHGEALLVFFGRHAVPGIEAYRVDHDDADPRIRYARTLWLPGGPAALELSWTASRLTAALLLSDDHDLAAGRERIEQLCDLGVDIGEVETHLGRDVELGPLVTASPGLRVPGAVDVHEHLFRTMIGQQISLAGAASCAGKIVARFGGSVLADGAPIDTIAGPLSRLFPAAEALATADPETLPMPRARGRAIVAMGGALADRALVLTRESDPTEARRALLGCRGIGPWTADYVLMRALQRPDILLTSDLVIKRELVRRGMPDPAPWTPWRSYATMHLWRAVTG